MWIVRAVVGLVIIDVVLGFLVEPDVHIYVSTSGSDSNNGLLAASPVQTLQKAVSLVQRHSGADVFVELMEGYHNLEHTLSIGHHPAHHLTIRSYGNGKEVHLTGGQRVTSNLFKPVTDHNVLAKFRPAARQHIRVAHLPDIGITNYGRLTKYGFGASRKAPLEIFFNGEPLRLARWPNEGFINIDGLPDGTHGTRFHYNSSRPSSWHGEQELWVYGYWYWSWADSAMKVRSLDDKAGIVTLDSHTQFGLKTGHWGDPSAAFTRQGGYFRFINILSELDEPGEYYMDNTTGNLYAWLPSEDGSAKQTDVIYVSILDTCIVLQNGAKDVTFSDITLEMCRKNALLARNVNNIQLQQMEVRNTGGRAVVMVGDSRSIHVSRSLIHDTDGGIDIYGGDRRTLTPSGNVIEDNELYRFARETATSATAIEIHGVNNIARYNYVHTGQYDGIRYTGNDNIMEYNHISHVCMNASDCGALHTGRDWTSRGNVIRNNIVHHTLRLVPGADCRGVMLDDQSSSTHIYNNVFYDNHVHVNIGGGRDNIVENNVMYNSTKSSMQVDGRGVKSTNDGDLYRHLHSVPYNSTLWETRYPAMKNFNSQNVSIPHGNQIRRNLVYNAGSEAFINGYNGWLVNPNLFNVTDNWFSLGPTDHLSTSTGDYNARCHSADWAASVHFGQRVTPNDVGPRHSVGPAYKQKARTVYPTHGPPGPCTTHAPASTQPMASYLPDGSRHNDLFNVSNQGCWFNVSGCTHDPRAVGTYRDTYGETHAHAADNETMCFRRAVAEWHYCGAHPNEQVAAIYGPSGATTVVGDGCFMIMYGCPKHGGPSDGHPVPGKINRDKWAEMNMHAGTDEEACLSRALGEWTWCGSSSNHPVTSLFRPTGARRTAGAGCWIQVQHCPKHPQLAAMFYDAWGATNIMSDTNEQACFGQAEYYWLYCGSDVRYPVTANYRPHATSQTHPNT